MRSRNADAYDHESRKSQNSLKHKARMASMLREVFREKAKKGWNIRTINSHMVGQAGGEGESLSSDITVHPSVGRHRGPCSLHDFIAPQKWSGGGGDWRHECCE